LLLIDPNYINEETIIDEVITFISAGSGTTASTLANTLSYLAIDYSKETKLRESLSLNFCGFGDKNISLENFAEQLTLETLDLEKDDYLKCCMYETLRIEPPISAASTACLTEDMTICGVKIRKGDAIT
jgi:cytochrome P450